MYLDLTDVYLHIAIRHSYRKYMYLRFALSETKRYQFRVLCFGVKTAPQVFSKVTVKLGAILHVQGMEIYQYLDDWLCTKTVPC